VVHRDLKPENIFLSGATAVLADFGVAKAVAGPQWSATLTSPGTTVGTPAYIAPEQLVGDADADHRGDLYSVGIIAYEMLAGRLPWSGGTPSEMLASQARGAIVSLQSLRPDVPAELVAVIEKCLAWDVAKRPASAADVLRVVETVSFIQTTPSSVVTRAPVQPFWRPKRARILAAVLVLAGGARDQRSTTAAG
jgi:serine/threonine protein kinase